jgi:hypothetical protein
MTSATNSPIPSMTNIQNGGCQDGGPHSDPCGKCTQACASSDNSISCDKCGSWYHQKCAGLNNQEFKCLGKQNSPILWFCPECQPMLRQQSQTDHTVNGKLDTILTLLTTLNTRIATLETRDAASTEYIDKRIDEKVHDAFREEMDKERRKCNLIIHGLEENANGDLSEQKLQDEGRVKDALYSIKAELTAVPTELTRLGEKKPGRIRPVRITVNSITAKRDILSKARLLRENASFDNVYIGPDLTFKEREANTVLVKELKTRRDAGERNLMISRGKIIAKPQAHSGERFQ